MTTVQEAFGQYLDLMASVQPGSRPALLGELNRAGEAALRKELDARPHSYYPIEATSPAAMFAPDYGVNINRVNLPVDAAASFRCGVPRLNSLLAVVANDMYYPTSRLEAECPDGLTVCSLRDVPEGLQVRVSEALVRGLHKGGPAAALNAMLLADGVLVHVAAGVKIEKAIQIVNIASVPVPSLLPRRVVVLADEGASVKVLLCDHTQAGCATHLCSQVVDIEAGEHAEVELYDIEEADDGSRRYWQLNSTQGAHSSVTVNTTALHSGRTRNEYRVEAPADHTYTSLSGLSICGKSQIVDSDIMLTHSGEHGTSRQLFKNALFEDARGGFSGKIIVNEGAMYTDAEQSNRNIVDGEGARMTTAPQLEIYCDEVKCSHGATTGQLDERALFYMQTRGIPAEEARRMLTQAFMADVVENVSFEVLRQRLHVLVEKRLSGAEASCEACGSGCHGDDNEEI